MPYKEKVPVTITQAEWKVTNKLHNPFVWLELTLDEPFYFIEENIEKVFKDLSPLTLPTPLSEAPLTTLERVTGWRTNIQLGQGPIIVETGSIPSLLDKRLLVDLEEDTYIDGRKILRPTKMYKENKKVFEKKTRKRFWMCMVDGGEIPKVQHGDYTTAQGEAERLARQTGRDVFLLEAGSFVRPADPRPPIQWQSTVS